MPSILRCFIIYLGVVFLMWATGCTSERQYVPSHRVIPIPASLVTVTPPRSGNLTSPHHQCRMDLTEELLENDTEVLAAIYGRILSQFSYPKIAQSNQWQGRVIVCADISQSGIIGDVSLYASSGNTSLDEEALKTVRSVGAVSLEHPLSQSHVLMQIPITYSPEKIGFHQELLADTLWQNVSAKATYPPHGLRSKVQGKVVLRVTLKPNGRVGLIEVQESSGNPFLDQAAIYLVNHPIPFRFLLPFPSQPSTFILPILYATAPVR